MNKEQTLVYIADPANHHKFNVISDWVMEEYKAFIATGEYPYLDAVRWAILDRHALTLPRHAEDPLQTLIYNCSCRYRADVEKAEGWSAVTTEELEALVGVTVEKKTAGIFGEGKIRGRIVKGGAENKSYFLMKPRARTRGYLVYQGDKIRRAA